MFKNTLQIQTTPQHDVKGTLHIQIQSITRNAIKGPFPFDNRYTCNTMSNLENAIKQVESYVTKAMNFTKEFTVTAKNTENINCYLYPGDVTFAGTACFSLVIHVVLGSTRQLAKWASVHHLVIIPKWEMAAHIILWTHIES